MLPAFLVLALFPHLQAASIAPPTSRADAWAFVRATGGDLRLDKPDATSGTLVHGSRRAFVALTQTAGDPAKGVPDTYPYVGLTLEWKTAREVDPDDFERWSAQARPDAKATLTPHLGRTATLWTFLPLMSASGPAALRAELDAFWADADRLAAHVGATPHTLYEHRPGALRFDPALRLKRADDVSLQRVFDSWGWHADETANVLVGGWGFPIRVGGRLLWVRGALDGQSFSTRRFTVERLAARGTTAPGKPLDIPNLYKLGPGTTYGGVFHPREAFVAFDLASPLALSDLRRRVEAFAAKG